MPLRDFPVLFKADLIFEEFSSKPSKFKYFSRKGRWGGGGIRSAHMFD